MSKAPSMPMYWDAYLADTTHLTTEEHGAYLLLLGAMWRRNGWIPDDDVDIARILRLTRAKWMRIRKRLAPFLLFEDGRISQKNLLKIWENTQEKIEKNRENGAKGGRPKSSKNKDITKPNGSVSQNPNETIPEPEPYTEPVREKENPNGFSKKADQGSRLPDDWMPDEIFAASEGLSAADTQREAQKFRDYWRSMPGRRGVKSDWQATWRNWVRKAAEQQSARKPEPKPYDWREDPAYRGVVL